MPPRWANLRDGPAKLAAIGVSRMQVFDNQPAGEAGGSPDDDVVLSIRGECFFDHLFRIHQNTTGQEIEVWCLLPDLTKNTRHG